LSYGVVGHLLNRENK